MPELRHVTLHLAANPAASTIAVDGVPLPEVTGVIVHSPVNDVTVVTLDLAHVQASVDGPAVLLVSGATRDALVSLGWVPPDVLASPAQYAAGRRDGVRATLARLADSYLITRGDPATAVAALRAELLPEETPDVR